MNIWSSLLEEDRLAQKPLLLHKIATHMYAGGLDGTQKCTIIRLNLKVISFKSFAFANAPRELHASQPEKICERTRGEDPPPMHSGNGAEGYSYAPPSAGGMQARFNSGL